MAGGPLGPPVIFSNNIVHTININSHFQINFENFLGPKILSMVQIFRTCPALGSNLCVVGTSFHFSYQWWLGSRTHLNALGIIYGKLRRTFFQVFFQWRRLLGSGVGRRFITTGVIYEMRIVSREERICIASKHFQLLWGSRTWTT